MKHYIIPLFIPHAGCPHQCVFCDQKQITGQREQLTAADIAKKIESYLSKITKDYYVEVAFYGGTFTALPAEVQEELIGPADAAYRAGRIDSIRLSTRPDAVDSRTLERLKNHGVKTVELGAQSFANEILQKAGRGHTADDIFRAAELVKQHGLELGIQLMPGLPGENSDTLRKSLDGLLRIKPQYVRLYPTVVIKDTPLAILYERGEFAPLSLKAAVRIVAAMKLALEREGIRVIRSGLQSAEELDRPGTVLAGPYHPAFGEFVENEIYLAMLTALLQEKTPRRVIVYHEAGETSKVRGVKNCNLLRLRELLPKTEWRFYSAPIGTGNIMVDCDGLIMKTDRMAVNINLETEGGI